MAAPRRGYYSHGMVPYAYEWDGGYPAPGARVIHEGLGAGSGHPYPGGLEADLLPPTEPAWMKIVRMAVTAGAAYHGYKRTGSIGWAVGWSVFGAFLPILAAPVILAQGFGKPKGR